MKQRIFITGSSDGLGFLAGKFLLEAGHGVVLHARNREKANELKSKLPACEAIVVGDVSTLTGIRSVAEQVNALGNFGTVIRNVGVYQLPDPQYTKDGVTKLFAVNVLTPFVLTAIIGRPERLIYMSSGMHSSGDAKLEDPQWKNRKWNTTQAYCDSKLFDLVLAKGIARRWPKVFSNAVDPGWVPTRMGGAGAPDDLYKGAETQAWLAVSDQAEARVTGHYFHHKKKNKSNPAADDVRIQDNVFKYLTEVSGVEIG